MSITENALKNHVVTYVCLFLCFCAGYMALKTIPQAEDPGFTIRVASVVTYLPGASPKRIEELITNEIEKKVQEIPELDYVKSESKSGVSIVSVVVKDSYSDLRPIWDNLRRKIDDVKGKLPKGSQGPFVNDEFGDVFGTVLTITGQGFTYSELENYTEFIKDNLLRISDIAKIDIYGIQKRKIYLEYNDAKLAQFGLSPKQLGNIISQQNIILSGGTVYTKNESISLEPTGNIEQIEQLQNLVLNIPNESRLIKLKDLVNIKEGYVDPPLKLVRADGNKSLSLGISMRTGGNIISLGNDVKNALKTINNHLPLGIKVSIPVFQSEVVEQKVNDFISNLYQAMAIVFVSMLVFLGFRTGIIVASLIPTALALSIVGMDQFGLSLDQMTLAALIIALGMLVDNGIVMVESISVQVKEGKSTYQASVDSAAELKIPLLTSSLTTSAAFLPLYLAESTMGEYIGVLFIVITLTLLASWVVAITIIPVISNKFLFSKKMLQNIKTQKAPQFDSLFFKRYRAVLKGCLKHRFAFVASVIAVFILSIYMLKFVPKIFFPENERPIITAQFKFPEGAPISKTNLLVEDLENYMTRELLVTEERKRGILNWVAYTGGGEPRFTLTYSPSQSSPNSTIFIINISEAGYTLSYDIRDKLTKYIADRYPDVKSSIKGIPQGATTANPFEVRIIGDNAEELFNISSRIKEKLRSIDGTISISDNWGMLTKKFIVDINPDRARRAGLTNEMIAYSLQYLLNGFEATQLRKNDSQIPIVIRSTDKSRLDLDKLQTINIFNPNSGKSITLKQIADIKVVWESAKIYRRNRLKTITVSAMVENGLTVGPVFNEIENFLTEDMKQWPNGYKWEFGGEKEGQSGAMTAVIDNFPLAGMIILLLLVFQFNSLKKPAIILLTIPLGMIGVTWGLLITDEIFGFMAFLGVVSLSGIIINNAIVLIDRIDLEINQYKRTPYQAIIEAGQRRLMPIVMTTVSTVGGLVPLWLFGGSMWSSMAVTIMFGLMAATVLTLGFVPVIYAIFFKVPREEINV